MPFKCPGCGRPLYNRRRSTCEFCAAPIPTSLLLSPTQQTRVEQMKQADRTRHREGMGQIARSGGGGGGGGDIYFGGGGGGCEGGGGGDCGCG